MVALAGRLDAGPLLASPAQSPLQPLSVQADETHVLAWTLFVGGTIAFAVVAAMAMYAVTRTPSAPSRLSPRAMLVGGGIAFPAVVLIALLVYTAVVGHRLGIAHAAPPLQLEITGEMWWWRVHYLAHDGTVEVATANQLVVPQGRPVEIRLRSADVIHSFWVPGLSGMLDMIPGRENTLRFTASMPGTLRGQCAEFCGVQHAKMGLDVRVLEPDRFNRWIAEQRTPATPPSGNLQSKGRDLFLAHCASCHAVRGTPAAATQGPDLTHVGSRPSIAASWLPNNTGTIAAWIASGQHLKPGNRMPEFRHLSGTELTALASYLSALQ